MILILKTTLVTCEQYHSHEYDSSLNRFGRSTISQSDNEKQMKLKKKLLSLSFLLHIMCRDQCDKALNKNDTDTREVI